MGVCPTQYGWVRAVAHDQSPAWPDDLRGAHDRFASLQMETYHGLLLEPADRVVHTNANTKQGNVPVWIVYPPLADKVAPQSDDGADHQRTDDKGQLPCIVYVCDWALGSFASHERLMRNLAHLTGAAVVFADYVGDGDGQNIASGQSRVWELLHWLAHADNGKGIDGTRIVIVSDGTGSRIAASLALDIGRDPILMRCVRAHILIGPILADPSTFAVGLKSRSASSPCAGKRARERVAPWWIDPQTRCRLWRLYSGGTTATTPMRASLQRLSAMAPTLIVMAGHDAFRAHGEMFAERLLKAGVAVKQSIFADAVHDFVIADALSHTPSAAGAVDRIAAFAVKHLNRCTTLRTARL